MFVTNLKSAWNYLRMVNNIKIEDRYPSENVETTEKLTVIDGSIDFVVVVSENNSDITIILHGVSKKDLPAGTIFYLRATTDPVEGDIIIQSQPKRKSPSGGSAETSGCSNRNCLEW